MTANRTLECGLCKDDLKWGASVCKSCGANIEYVNTRHKAEKGDLNIAFGFSLAAGFIVAIITMFIGATLSHGAGDGVFAVAMSLGGLVFVTLMIVLVRGMSGVKHQEVIIPHYSQPKSTTMFFGTTIGGD